MTYPGQCDDCPGRSHALCCRNTEDYQRPPTNNSAVARLMAQITGEHEAAQRGIAGIAEGTARHSFIAAHMDRLCALKDELSCEVGDDTAMVMVCGVVLDESAEVL